MSTTGHGPGSRHLRRPLAWLLFGLSSLAGPAGATVGAGPRLELQLRPVDEQHALQANEQALPFLRQAAHQGRTGVLAASPAPGTERGTALATRPTPSAAPAPQAQDPRPTPPPAAPAEPAGAAKAVPAVPSGSTPVAPGPRQRPQMAPEEALPPPLPKTDPLHGTMQHQRAWGGSVSGADPTGVGPAGPIGGPAAPLRGWAVQGTGVAGGRDGLDDHHGRGAGVAPPGNPNGRGKGVTGIHPVHGHDKIPPGQGKRDPLNGNASDQGGKPAGR